MDCENLLSAFNAKINLVSGACFAFYTVSLVHMQNNKILFLATLYYKSSLLTQTLRFLCCCASVSDLYCISILILCLIALKVRSVTVPL